MNIYVKALIPTLLVFLIGVMVGIWIDNFRVTEVRKSISESEINWNDAQLFNSYFKGIGLESCDVALEQNLAYNEKIYQRGLEVEKVIKNNVFTPEALQEWKRYNLLQIQFWLNSIELKEKCGFNYHNVVHLFRLNENSRVEEVDNKVQSSVLLDVKERCGNKIMLIPVTTDLDLIVVNSIIRQYNITTYPSIVIDENIVLEGLTSEKELLAMLDCDVQS